MKDLDRDVRALLDAAARADAAPAAIRLRARKRFLGAVAAGTVTTSAVLGKGAWLGATATGIGSGASVGAATSLGATLVSAVVIGLSTGLVAVSPASKIAETAHIGLRPATAQPVAAPQPTPARRQTSPSAPPIGSVETVERVEVPHATDLPSSEAHFVGAQRVESTQHKTESEPLLDHPAEVSSAVATPTQAYKASIARETELLAEVQRALKTGRPMLALLALDRYDEECQGKRLYEEATASRVVALCAVGRITEGRRWGLEFLRRFPNSPLSTRVRSACKSVPTPGAGEDVTRP